MKPRWGWLGDMDHRHAMAHCCTQLHTSPGSMLLTLTVSGLADEPVLHHPLNVQALV
jgi:hypothetical protein